MKKGDKTTLGNIPMLALLTYRMMDLYKRAGRLLIANSRAFLANWREAMVFDQWEMNQFFNQT